MDLGMKEDDLNFHVMPRMYKKYRNTTLVINVTSLCLINMQLCHEQPLSNKA